MFSRNNIYWLMSVALALFGGGGCITKMCDNPWLMPATIPLDVATSPVQLLGGMVFWCAMYEPEKWGSITVTGCDIYGRPITNAVLHVDTCVHYGFRPVLSDDYRHYEGRTDCEGKATVKFKRRWRDVDWRLDAPDHYSINKFTERPENKCKLRRSLKLYPKRNPQPMYAYGEDDDILLPNDEMRIVTNGNVLVSYPDFDVDIEKMSLLPSDYVKRGKGVVSDFRIETSYVETNGILRLCGRMIFAPGCGAYIRHKTGDESFPSAYVADTNAVYENVLTFWFERRAIDNKTLAYKALLKKDEYMVMRTRMAVSEDGATNGWHYSKILGPIRIKSDFACKQSVFNPRLNDPNLEFDMERNLAKPKSDVRWP